MEVQPCSSLVINAPEFFRNPRFMAWLNDPETRVFSWHRKGEAASDYSDVVVLVDPSLNGEGTDSDMPESIWRQIIAACKKNVPNPLPGGHIAVRLTNLESDESKPHVYSCEECDWTGTLDEMASIDDIHERVQPGEFMAAGQCPECDSLIGVADCDIPDYTLEQAAEILRKQGWSVVQPTK